MIKNGANKNTLHTLFDNTITVDDFNVNKAALLDMIEYFTLDEASREKFREEDVDFDFDEIPYNKEKGMYVINYEGKEIYFNLLTNILYFENKKENSMYKELLSYDRYHKCHEMAEKLIDLEGVSIVSGFENIIGDLIFHSVVEIEEENNDFILDYTKNLLMKKEDYYELTGFKEVQKISSEQYNKDKEKLDMIAPFDFRLYLAFKDELIDDIDNTCKKLQMKG